MIGALCNACGHDWLPNKATRFVVSKLNMDIDTWNDAPGRTQAEVVELLERLANGEGTNTDPTCPDCGEEFEFDEPIKTKVVCYKCGCRFEASPSFEITWLMTRLKECDECGRTKYEHGLCGYCKERLAESD